MKQFDKASEARLLELMKEELEIFEQMKEQATEHIKILAADKMDAFFKSLDSTDKLKEKINGLHQEIEPLMQSYVSSSKAPGQKGIKEIDTLKKSVGKVVKECVDLNKEVFKVANVKKDEYTERLKELDKSKKTFKAYKIDIPDNSEHFDKTT